VVSDFCLSIVGPIGNLGPFPPITFIVFGQPFFEFGSGLVTLITMFPPFLGPIGWDEE
jgi:hypothetical protein